MLFAQVGEAFAEAIRDHPADGLKILLAVETKIVDRGVTDPESEYKVAQAYIALGDKESALRMLRRTVEGGFFCFPYLASDPLTSALHSDPEFKLLLAEAERRHNKYAEAFCPQGQPGR
jgi:hypothetical protein